MISLVWVGSQISWARWSLPECQTRVFTTASPYVWVRLPKPLFWWYWVHGSVTSQAVSWFIAINYSKSHIIYIFNSLFLACPNYLQKTVQHDHICIFRDSFHYLQEFIYMEVNSTCLCKNNQSLQWTDSPHKMLIETVKQID